MILSPFGEQGGCLSNRFHVRRFHLRLMILSPFGEQGGCLSNRFHVRRFHLRLVILSPFGEQGGCLSNRFNGPRNIQVPTSRTALHSYAGLKVGATSPWGSLT